MPVVIIEITVEERQKHHRFNLHRAYWKAYKSLTYVANDDEERPLDEMLCQLEHIIQHAALLSIPQSSDRLTRRPLPWWSVECSTTRWQKREALRRYQQNKTVGNRVVLNRARAIARRTQRLPRRKCWQDFVKTINSNTPLDKIFKKVKKIHGKFNGTSSPCLQDNGALVLDAAAVADMLGQHFSDVSSRVHYPHEFLPINIPVISTQDCLAVLDTQSRWSGRQLASGS